MAATAAATSSYHHSSSNHLERAGPIPIRAAEREIEDDRTLAVRHIPGSPDHSGFSILDFGSRVGSAYEGPGRAVGWVGPPHGTHRPLFTARRPPSERLRPCAALVVLPPTPVDRPDAGLAAMFTRFPDMAESIPAANCVAVNPQQSARYSPAPARCSSISA